MLPAMQLSLSAALLVSNGFQLCRGLSLTELVSTEVRSGPGRPRALSLTEGSSESYAGASQVMPAALSALGASDGGRGNEVPAAWFGDFDQGESSFDVDGMDAYVNENGARKIAHGKEVGFTNPFSQPDFKSGSWFAETPSGGSNDAWQTFYPQPHGGLVGTKGAHAGKWRSTPEGWYQDYVPQAATANTGAGPNSAQWFDSSVANYDGFGRKNTPTEENPRHLQFYDSIGPPSWGDAGGGPWGSRSTNATLACPGVACIATAGLGVYDPATEDASNCRLAIKLHPTDFDNDFDDEYSHTWLVNNHSVRSKCDPMARGCNDTAWRPLYNCLTDFSVDHLLDSQGVVQVQGQLSEMVDECPYDGNLLSGVAFLTCMVRTKPKPPPVEITTEATLLNTSATGLLRCKTPGCSAQTVIRVDPTVAANGGKCLMNVTVVNTDFDGSLADAPEVIEFISLQGKGNLSADAKPGVNPCLSEYGGTPVAADKLNFSIAENEDVTAEVLAAPSGFIVLQGKISQHVDECAHEGYLLYAAVEIYCDGGEGLNVTVSSDSGSALAEVDPSGNIVLTPVQAFPSASNSPSLAVNPPQLALAEAPAIPDDQPQEVQHGSTVKAPRAEAAADWKPH